MATPPSGPPGRGPLPPIDFAALAHALLQRADTLVPEWLPGGVQRGHEYQCGSLSGGKGTSCSVNLTTGRGSDFATGETWGDLVGLYALIHGLDMGKAAVELARAEGLEDVAGVMRTSAPGAPPPAPRPPPPPAPPPAPAADREGWRSNIPVPQAAPAATFKHQYRHTVDIEHTAEYRIGEHLFGYVVRFKTSEGGKETLPYTWCTSERDGASRWHWRQWDTPRPLYFPLRAKPDGLTVVLVEGEKKADVLQWLLELAAPGVYLVATWPGGCKAWQKACWDWLAGRTVLLWPDCDSKREPLTKKERDALLAQVPAQLDKIGGQVTENDRDRIEATVLALGQQQKPLLPEHKQPGMAAMLGIGHLLQGQHGCRVQMLQIPKPGEVADGWDCADAINSDGWTADKLLAFFAGAQPLPPADAGTGKAAAGAADLPHGAAAGGAGGGDGGKNRDGPAEAEDSDDEFAAYLSFMCEAAKCKTHELGVNRKMLIKALRSATLLRDCLAYSELSDAPCTRVAWPWRDAAGPLQDSDPLRLGDFLSRTYSLKAASVAALQEAIETVADERRYHPVRDWLNAIEHDGKPRLDKWLIYVLGHDPEKLPPRLCTYLQMVGRFTLMGLVARAMQPGCKFDYSPVLEGKTGMGKSTFIKVLVGEEFFSDTHFDVGQGKDGMEQFSGLWAYELSELTALRRADSEQVKQFFSSQIDRFRGAYGRYVQAHPRQLVIFCSTNKQVYLYDTTGNRRFWPFWIGQPLKLDWLAKWREQLFAEAVKAFKAGERYYPTREEEDKYFVPEQAKRLAETSVQSRLYDLLTREGAPGGEGKLSAGLTVLTEFVTMDALVAALGTDPGKSSAVLEGQIRGWLEAYGWQPMRETGARRRRGYRQPTPWPPVIEDDEPPAPPGAAGVDGSGQAQPGPNGGADDAPF